jgi:hypothetical protein
MKKRTLSTPFTQTSHPTRNSRGNNRIPAAGVFCLPAAGEGLPEHPCIRLCQNSGGDWGFMIVD